MRGWWMMPADRRSGRVASRLASPRDLR
jgi:hypothetical protein